MTPHDAAPTRRALLSTSDKTGLPAFAAALAATGVELVSTGGTARALREAGLAVTEVAEITGAPEMLDGRVKTLHPSVHGGLLARRDDPAHMAAIAAAGVAPIDALVVNLYPFEATVRGGAGFAEAIENIDVGGPAMIRAAAKNFESVLVVTDPGQYEEVAAALADGRVDLALRRRLALAAFQKTAAYDAAIAEWLAPHAAGEGPNPGPLTLSAAWRGQLRYGENPHQRAAVYATADPAGAPSVVAARLRSGKPLSFNNYADADAAFELAAELDRFGAPAVVIVKHANPCGAALGPDLAAAYEAARRTDPVSAFGGVVAANREIDAATAHAVREIFTEVVVAPAFSEAALEILSAKKDLRLLETGGLPDPTAPRRMVSTLRGGLLVQDADVGRIEASALAVATKRAPTAAETADLLFAWTVAKHVKSNAIVYAKDGATVGVGAGQMSRVDSTRIAARKAEETAGPSAPSAAVGSVVASDAFFPFADGLLTAAEAGATAVIQPGGSIRDAEVIAAADEAGIAMVFTGMRHFRH